MARGWFGEPGRHADAARGICTTVKKVDPEEVVNTEDFPMPGFPDDDLKERLLSIGGKRVIIFSGDPDTDDILARGELINGRGASFIQGNPSQCHSNVGYLFEQFPDTTRVMTGYALSKDGIWRQHSWLIDIEPPGREYITETTESRELYYGFRMTKRESEKFAEENSGPGFDY